MSDLTCEHVDGWMKRSPRGASPASEGPSVVPPSLVARVMTGAIVGYRRISAATAPRCRYYPSCSTYALQAVAEHGAARGFLLSVWRVLRCNPWTKGGVDDVPETFHLSWHRHLRYSVGDGGVASPPNTRPPAPKEQ